MNKFMSHKEMTFYFDLRTFIIKKILIYYIVSDIQMTKCAPKNYFIGKLMYKVNCK